VRFEGGINWLEDTFALGLHCLAWAEQVTADCMHSAWCGWIYIYQFFCVCGIDIVHNYHEDNGSNDLGAYLIYPDLLPIFVIGLLLAAKDHLSPTSPTTPGLGTGRLCEGKDMCSQERKWSSKEEEGWKKERARGWGRGMQEQSLCEKGLELSGGWAGISGCLNLRDEEMRWCWLIFNARY